MSRKEYIRTWKAANPDKNRDYCAKFRNGNRKAYVAARRRYYMSNMVRILAEKAVYYQEKKNEFSNN